MGAFADFNTRKVSAVDAKTAISLVSIEQARLNLKTEMNPFNWDFDAVHNNAKKVWNGMLRQDTGAGAERKKKKRNSIPICTARMWPVPPGAM